MAEEPKTSRETDAFDPFPGSQENANRLANGMASGSMIERAGVSSSFGGFFTLEDQKAKEERENAVLSLMETRLSVTQIAEIKASIDDATKKWNDARNTREKCIKEYNEENAAQNLVIEKLNKAGAFVYYRTIQINGVDYAEPIAVFRGKDGYYTYGSDGRKISNFTPEEVAKIQELSEGKILSETSETRKLSITNAKHADKIRTILPKAMHAQSEELENAEIVDENTKILENNDEIISKEAKAVLNRKKENFIVDSGNNTEKQNADTPNNFIIQRDKKSYFYIDQNNTRIEIDQETGDQYLKAGVEIKDLREDKTVSASRKSEANKDGEGIRSSLSSTLSETFASAKSNLGLASEKSTIPAIPGQTYIAVQSKNDFNG